eukprot:snap_masked-scaffold_10-processed-gene-2.28-mRNA-1 protein AED:0.88 eAED:1.00 QI:0/0/0/0.5/1/1/2/0/73
MVFTVMSYCDIIVCNYQRKSLSCKTEKFLYRYIQIKLDKTKKHKKTLHFITKNKKKNKFKVYNGNIFEKLIFA